LGSVLEPEYIRDAGWLADWHGPVWSAEQMHEVHYERLLEALATVASLGFVITCFTVVTLVLIRAATRTPELALRLAVGATRRRLLHGLLAEGILLAGLSGALGLTLGILGLHLARFSWPGAMASASGGIGPWLAPIAMLTPLVTAVPFALVAAAGVLRRSDLSGALLAGADGTAGQGELILQDFLAVVQLAAAVALVIGAGLLVRNAMPTPGESRSAFAVGDVAMFQLDLREMEGNEIAALADFYESVLDDAAELNGQGSAALATPGAWLGIGSLVFVTVQCGRCYRGQVYVPVMPGYVRVHAVSPDFFANSGVRVLEGREFTADDRLGSPRVMLVNRNFAESHFEGGRPLGRQVQIGGVQDPWHTVVGIVEDLNGRGIGPPSRSVPVAYVPILQEPSLAADLALFGSDNSEERTDAVTSAVAGAGEAEVSAIFTGAAYVKRQAGPVRWLATAFAAAGALTLVLGVFGSYSVMRFKVSRCRREIGLRRALGARRSRIVRLVLLRSLGLAAVGGGLGALSGLLVAGWLDMIVPGLEAVDPAVYGVTIAMLVSAGLVGGSLAVGEATRIDPAVAIRTE
jgi:predicted permease